MSNVSRRELHHPGHKMLIDLIAATAEEAQAIMSTPGHANVWPTLETKTVDQVKRASLAFILKGKPPEDEPVIEYMKTFQNVASGGDEGPWIDLLPRTLPAAAHVKRWASRGARL